MQKMNIVTITPEKAKALLETSRGNPRWVNGQVANRRRVKQIAADILAGTWTLSPNPICIDTRGRLTDGHHRLSACILADKPITVWLCTEVDEEAQVQIDGNRSRTNGQRLGIDKVDAAVLALLFYVTKTTAMAPTAEMLGAINRIYGDELAEVKALTGWRSGTIYSSANFLYAVFAAYHAGVDYVYLRDFKNVLMTGFSEGLEQSAAIVIRNQFASPGARARSTPQARLSAIKNIEAGIYDFAHAIPRKKSYSVNHYTYSTVLIAEEIGRAENA